MSDAEIDALKRGGHDFRKLYAAFAAAARAQAASRP
jgi:pyruvate dehydrogenase E1 component